MRKKSGTASESKAKKKTITSEEAASIRVDALFDEAAKFCGAVGLRQDLMHQIYNAENDWTFILKIDALLETATKEVIKSALKMQILNRFVGAEELGQFVDGLPMNGKTSLVQLLKASGCPSEDSEFVEAVRRVRNAYAHNIKLADLTIIQLVRQRPDKSHIIRNISNVTTYDEARLIANFEKDGKLMRFSILDATMRILFYAYHIAMK
jgi:hypothetical protein